MDTRHVSPVQESRATHSGGVARLSVLAAASFVLALIGAAAAVAAGLGYRLEWWSLGAAFSMLRWASYGMLGVMGVAIAGLVDGRPGGPRRGWVLAALALAIGLVVVRIPWGWQQAAREAPRIHDITTDVDDPPAFVAIVPLRADAPNPVAYGGPEIAAAQRKAYPDIQPMFVASPPGEVFRQAVAVVQGLDWKLVSAVKSQGRIEATDTTFWFGFRDDVVIRIRAEPPGSRVDMRSLSRVGRSDLGVNAARIRLFMSRLRAAVEAKH